MQLRHRRGTILWHHVIDSNSDLLGTFMAGWLCDLDAKTAPLVHGAQGAEAQLLVLPSICQVCFHDFSCVVGVVLCRSV